MDNTLLPKQKWRFGEEKILRVTIKDDNGGALSGLTGQFLVYSSAGSLLATLTCTVSTSGNRADLSYVVTAKASTGTFTSTGSYTVVAKATLSSNIQEWRIPIEVVAVYDS